MLGRRRSTLQEKFFAHSVGGMCLPDGHGLIMMRADPGLEAPAA
jgi:hypothetical protein